MRISDWSSDVCSSDLRVDGMLRGARINAEWMDAPTAADVRARDQERLMEKLLTPVEHEAEDIELAQRLMAERTPEDIARSEERSVGKVGVRTWRSRWAP